MHGSPLEYISLTSRKGEYLWYRFHGHNHQFETSGQVLRVLLPARHRQYVNKVWIVRHSNLFALAEMFPNQVIMINSEISKRLLRVKFARKIDDQSGGNILYRP